MPWTLLAPLALAHDPDGEVGLRPFVRDGELVGGWTSAGLVRVDADGVPRQVCDEALERVNDVWLRADGSFVFATFDGLQRSDDGGCTRVVDALHPEPASRMWAAADGALLLRVDHDDGTELLRSDDDGATFVALAPLPEPLVVGSFAEATNGAWWFWSGDGAVVTADRGETWSLVDGPPTEAFVSELLGPSPTGAGVAVASWSLDGTAEVWAGDGDWELILGLPLVPRGFGCAGSCAVGVDVASLAFDPGAPAASLHVTDGPTTCVAALDGELWGCGARGAPGLFARGDGDAFAWELPRTTLAPRVCAACPAPTAPPDGDPAPAASPPPVELRGGCATSPPSPGPIALLALWRRRKRSAPLAVRRSTL